MNKITKLQYQKAIKLNQKKENLQTAETTNEITKSNEKNTIKTQLFI